jgi:transposase-like protein
MSRVGKRAIARKLRISPDTLYRWIREGDLD